MKIQELEQKYEELGKEIEKLKLQQDEVIYVPENIQFEIGCGTGDNLGLVFDTDRVLFTKCNKLIIYEVYRENFVKCKLIKVDKPQAGNWYYCSDEDSPDFSNKSYYHKYVNDEKYKWVETDIAIEESKATYKNYWQVKEIEWMKK